MSTLSALERAPTYAGFFLNMGDRWRSMVPVDAEVSGETVHLQGVCMERLVDGWRLTENGTSWLVRPKPTPAAAVQS